MNVQAEVKAKEAGVNCKCIAVLLDGGYLTTATSIDQETGKTTPLIVLGKLKEGKDGRLTVKPNWFVVRHCPSCGAKIDHAESVK
jgi:hypothetical protein